MSYCRMSPCSQLLKYRKRSSSEIKISVMRPMAKNTWVNECLIFMFLNFKFNFLPLWQIVKLEYRKIFYITLHKPYLEKRHSDNFSLFPLNQIVELGLRKYEREKKLRETHQILQNVFLGLYIYQMFNTIFSLVSFFSKLVRNKLKIIIIHYFDSPSFLSYIYSYTYMCVYGCMFAKVLC